MKKKKQKWGDQTDEHRQAQHCLDNYYLLLGGEKLNIMLKYRLFFVKENKYISKTNSVFKSKSNI